MSEAIRREPLLVGINTPLSHPTTLSGRDTRNVEAECLTHERQAARTAHDSPASGKYSFFKNAQWSADGTTLLASGADNVLRTFILPSDLLEPPSPHGVLPYSQHALPEPSYATAIYPFHNLAEPSTCLFVASVRDLPMRLLSPFAREILATYPLVSPTTEAWIAPHSLIFSPNEPNTFFAGADGLIAEFDLQRSGEGPVTRMRTGRGRTRNGVQGLESEGMNGIVSAMAINTEGILAAGTFTRRVGLYDSNGRGETIGSFDLGQRNEGEGDVSGLGITQVLWSPCGRYLCIAERSSDGVSVRDIRGTGQRLAWLEGRQAKTQQRLGVDMMGDELWAGGTDGVVRAWKNVGMEHGVVSPACSFQAHGDPIGSTALHPAGSVLATCSGQRSKLASEYEIVDSELISSASCPTSSYSEACGSPIRSSSDNSFKIWAI